MHNYLDTAGLKDFAQKLTAKNKTMFAVKSLETDVEELRAAVGSPLVAEEAADMTETDKIYVYVGEETGYTAGDWYYYDGTEWQDGGVYNSTAFTADTSLSNAGEAADAKAAGEIIAEARNIGLGNMKLVESTPTWSNRQVDPGDGSIASNNKYINGKIEGDCDYIIVTGIPSTVDCALYGYSGTASATSCYAGIEADFGDTQTSGTRIFRITKGIVWYLNIKNKNNTNISTTVGEGLTIYRGIAVTEDKEAYGVHDVLTHEGTVVGKQLSWEIGTIPASGDITGSDAVSIKMMRTDAYDCTPGDTYKITTSGVEKEGLIVAMYADTTLVKRMTDDDAKEFIVPRGVNKIRFANGRKTASTITMKDPFTFINAFKVTVTMQSINDYLSSIGYIPITQLKKGAWQKNGTVAPAAKGISIYPLLEAHDGEIINVRINGDWCYSVWSGDSATDLTQDYRLVQYSQFVCKGAYVGLSLYKMVDGEVVNTLVKDYDGNFLIFEGGNEVENDERNEIPENLGVINVINRAYQMCKQSAETVGDLPTQVNTSAYPHVFPTGTVLKGTIYSSVRQRADYVPQCVNWQSYFTSIKNANSYIYTKEYTQADDYNCRTYYGAVCSSMVAYCYGIDTVIPTTYTFHTYPGMYAIEDQSAYGLKLGDCLSNGEDPDAPHHIVIVTGIVKNTRGYIKSVEVCSQQTPFAKRVSLTPEQVNRMIAGTYSTYPGHYAAYRYRYIYKVPYTATPWINLDEETADPVFAEHLLPLRGDTSNWYLGEDVEVWYDNSGSIADHITFTNRDTEAETDIPINAEESTYTFTGLAAGRYKLTLGTEEAYFDVIESAETFYASGGTLHAEFACGLGTAASIVLCEADSSDSDYRATQAFHVFTDAEITAGACDWTGAPSGTYLAGVFYKTEYGLLRCASMQSVTI